MAAPSIPGGVRRSRQGSVRVEQSSSRTAHRPVQHDHFEPDSYGREADSSGVLGSRLPEGDQTLPRSGSPGRQTGAGCPLSWSFEVRLVQSPLRLDTPPSSGGRPLSPPPARGKSWPRHQPRGRGVFSH